MSRIVGWRVLASLATNNVLDGGRAWRCFNHNMSKPCESHASVLSRRVEVIWPMIDASISSLNLTTDGLIRRYTYFVIAGHVLAWLYFLDTSAFAHVLVGTEPLCWPYFQSCWRVRLQNTTQIWIVLALAFGLLLTSTVMLRQRRPIGSWAGLTAATGLLFAFVSLDYRLRSNEVYMLFWLTTVVLFWPVKRWAVPIVIVSFYFWAGRLKLNRDWLSGNVLYFQLFLIPPEWAWLACVYVVILETVLIWGLLARRRLLLWATLGQLGLFHLESLTQIHWFYPALMGCILSWFVLQATSTNGVDATISSLFRLRAPVSTYFLAGLFSICQMIPSLYPGDPAITGQGRVFALHMFEARQQCAIHAVLHMTNGSTQTVDLKLRWCGPGT